VSPPMAEQLYEVGDGVTLCAEAFGDPGDPPVLLIMGLGMQMVRWHPLFIAELTRRGLYVVRFDNRDSGRSTFFDDVPPPSLRQLASRRFSPKQYTLADMASDTAGLIDAMGLGGGSVHVVGASMGGMIAQTLTIRCARKVRSLTSIMSNTGARWSGQPALHTYPVLLKRPPRDREGFIAHQEAVYRAVGSPGTPPDDPLFREIAELSYDRNPRRSGTPRQLAAILASGDRTSALRRVRVPTLVIHGDADRLVSGQTARAIPGAQLDVIPGMGHDLPRAVWPEVTGAIARHVAEAERARRETAALAS
jgi:pimeloyl-ACP methyl ester carboxylesterase